MIYIALLRGINVGGKNMIKMAELKRILEESGLCEVQTYIQSGNVLFKSIENEEYLAKKIEYEIERFFGFFVPAVLRTATEIEQIIMNCPFSEEEVSKAEASSQTECLYVSLMTQAPLQEKIEKLNAYQNDVDDYRIIDRDVFLLFRNSIRNSKLANNLHKLDVPATVRNWKTLNKLLDLSKTMAN